MIIAVFDTTAMSVSSDDNSVNLEVVDGVGQYRLYVDVIRWNLTG